MLQHTVSANNDFPEQAWADTLFMAAFFLLRVGVKLKDEEIIEDALNQYYWHIHYLQNPETGLYYHGYNLSLIHIFSGDCGSQTGENLRGGEGRAASGGMPFPGTGTADVYKRQV